MRDAVFQQIVQLEQITNNEFNGDDAINLNGDGEE